MVVRVCELCGGEAVLYCGSDAAFLCWKCDARVHEVNFLVARHVRHPIKEVMMNRDCFVVGGLGFGDSDSDPEPLSSSSCISSTNYGPEKLRKRPTKTRKTRKQSELVRWCGEIIGVGGDDVIVALGSRIFSLVCGSGLSGRSRRVWLAASFWLGMRLRKTASFEKMRRLEKVSGVAEELILVGLARIVRMLKDRKISRSGRGDVAVDREEGWAESC